MWFIWLVIGILLGHYVIRDIKSFVKSRQDK